jgi:signal transduction histidine kinase
MTAPEPADVEQRLLVLRPAGADLDLVQKAVREAELRPAVCGGVEELCHKVLEGAVAALLSADTLTETAASRLAQTLAQAPPWSDLTLVLLAPANERRRAKAGDESALNRLGNVIWLERPVRLRTLVSVLRAARRDRRRQYELRRLLQEQQHSAEHAQALAEQMEAFTYSISHDLRAPLRAVRGFAQALAEDYSAAVDGPGRDYLRRIEQGAERLDRLIEDLLQYSRLGRSPLTLSPVNLEPLIQIALQQFQTEIRTSAAVLEIEKPLPRVIAHESTLQQVLASLISNAVKFVAPGVRPRVRIWGSENGPNARLWIADNGIGIAPAFHRQIFGVFERLHGTEAYPGTGMGLAIAAKGMARMRGSIGLESALGAGSRFWIELSRAPSSE